MGEMWDGQSLILGQYKGVPVGLHFTLLLLALVDEIFWIAHNGGWGFFKGIFLTLTLWFTVFVHEMGHVWMCRRLGGEPDRIILWPFGGLAYMKHSGDESDRTKILLAGPLMHIPLGLFAAIWIAIFTGGPFLWYVDWCFHLNLQLFLLNLFVPAHPLDGCSMFACSLLNSYSTDTTAKIYICLAVPFIVFLAWWGFAETNFLAVILAFWMVAQTADLIIRIRQGPAGLAKHPMFTIADQMKPKNKSQQRGVDISSWDGSAQSYGPSAGGGGAPPVQTNWGSGTVGGVPVVGVPTGGNAVPQEQVETGVPQENPYVGGVDKKPQSEQYGGYGGGGNPGAAEQQNYNASQYVDQYGQQQNPYDQYGQQQQQQYADPAAYGVSPAYGGAPAPGQGSPNRTVTVEMAEIRAGGGSPQIFSIPDGEGQHTTTLAAPGVEPSPREHNQL
ncbi:unnamed protein product [Amoebophrya sp. A25]|nr:unnamed protein product [Amoebophrya sp. A25]|eukprot:GSA25T00020177001.1